MRAETQIIPEGKDTDIYKIQNITTVIDIPGTWFHDLTFFYIRVQIFC